MGSKFKMGETKIITGKVSNVYYYSSDTAWASFMFGYSPKKNNLHLGKNSVKCCGVIPGIKVGDRLTLQGTLEESKYGLQLKVISYTDDSFVDKDSAPEEVEAFICSGIIKGCGPKTGEKIYAMFKEKSLDIIENDYKKLTLIDGIGPTKAEQIHNNYNLESGMRKIVSSLMPFGISVNMAFKLYNKWGLNAVDTVTQNPYLMADPEIGIDGIGFKKADEVGRKLGFEHNAPLRLQSLISYLLVHGSMDGNIYYTYEELLKIGDEYFQGITVKEIQETLDALETAKKIVREENRIYAVSHYKKEKFNAEKLVVLNQSELKECKFDLRAIERALGGDIAYDESQQKAIELASLDTTGVMVLTGWPGSGKSTTTRGIIEMYKQSGLKIYCAAPTGRAAKRMQEVTGFEASTIHRLLGCQGGNTFTMDHNNQLDCDVLIIDEASMIDNNLMYSLLLAVKEGTRVLFIGDVDQLPSIGAGNLLRDMIASEFFAVAILKTVHRQAEESMIISNAHAINEGREIRIQNTEDSDCIFMDIDEIGDDEAVLDKITSLVVDEVPRKYGYNPMDVQVLMPMKGVPLGVNNVNARLQKALQTSDQKVSTPGKVEFYVGDKVMQIKNNIRKNVFNGDIGIVDEIDNVNKEVIVKYPNTDMTSAFPYVYVAYDFHELDELILAYACTIHKSQGSEYPVVVMVVSYQHYIMLQRNLIYTGITRAKKLCFILGTKKAIHHASNTVPVQKRNTTLITRIYDFVAELEEEFDNEEYDEDDFEEVEEGEETFEQFEFIDF